MPSFSFGHVVLCDFPFTSGDKSKRRPALVLFDLGEDVLICRITSALHGGTLDIPIYDWEPAGLLFESEVRLSRLVTIEKSLLLRKLGRLSSRDRQAVQSAWNRHMMLPES